jgi:hypothetical protein
MFTRRTVLFPLALSVFLLFLASPSFSAIPAFNTPHPFDIDGMDQIQSVDKRIKVFYVPQLHGVPNVDRYAIIWEGVDSLFTNVSREEANLEIYLLPYKKFVQRMDRNYGSVMVDGIRESIESGAYVFHAHTYNKKNTTHPTIVIEAYEILSDATLIHELLHHYLEQVTLDGSLNDHQLITPYTIHVESLISRELIKALF